MDDSRNSQKITNINYLTVDQARKLIPTVQTKVFCIHQINQLINNTLDKLGQIGVSYKPDLLQKLAPDEDMETIDLLSTLKVSLSAIKKEIKQLEDLGCSLEDIDTGKVTWTAVEHGEMMQLAWSNETNGIETRRLQQHYQDEPTD